MNSAPPLPIPECKSKSRPMVRLWLVVPVLAVAALILWLAWPSRTEINPFELSRADGKPRFYATTYSKAQMPLNFTLSQRLSWWWMQLKQRYRKRNPLAYSFPAMPVQLCSIQGLLNQCMDVTGTRYFMAVEIVGAVEFGNTNILNGAQMAAAFERALETSNPVGCYDYAQKRNFEDVLLLIRERPGVVKVVPRSKLDVYQKAGLVKAGSPILTTNPH